MISINTNQLKTTEYHKMISEIVVSYFPLFLTEDKALLNSLMKLSSQPDAVYINAGPYKIISHAKTGVAISADFVHVMDYFVEAHKNTNIHFECQPVDFFDYHLLQQKLKQHGAIEYPLVSLLWQVYHHILPQDLSTHDTKWLKLKITAMPEFNAIGAVPEYIPRVIQHCMQESKTIAELNVDFPNVTSDRLHRVLLLCILTGVVDLDVLYLSHQDSKKSLSEAESLGVKAKESSKNSSYSSESNRITTKQPNKIGFLSRFLYK